MASSTFQCLSTLFCFEDSMLKNKILLNILKDLKFSFTKFCCLKKVVLEKVSISENNLISGEATKVLL